MFQVSNRWRLAFPGANAGILVMHDVINSDRHEELEQRKELLQDRLRAQYMGYDRKAFGAIPRLQAYAAHFKKFTKTYHVALQLESVVLKGKPIPSVAALVEAMFMAELESLLLTAGHDLDSLQGDVTLDVSTGGEQYVLMRGQEQLLKPGDMLMSDEKGVFCSVIYGPDARTQINPATRRVMFVVYAPAGIGEAAVAAQLDLIATYVLCVAPGAVTVTSQVFAASTQ
jgi:DNA/RNA-binding domain of Phe-tRNA-synthetase-like protein